MSKLPHAFSANTTGGRGKCLPSHLPLDGGQEILCLPGPSRVTRLTGGGLGDARPAGAESANAGYLVLLGEPQQCGFLAGYLLMAPAGHSTATNPTPTPDQCHCGSSLLSMGGGGVRCFPGCLVPLGLTLNLGLCSSREREGKA